MRRMAFGSSMSAVATIHCPSETQYGASSYWVDFDRSGRLVTTSYDGLAEHYDKPREHICGSNFTGPPRAAPRAALARWKFSPDGLAIEIRRDDRVLYDSPLEGTGIRTLGPPSIVSSVRQLLPVVSGASASPIPFAVLRCSGSTKVAEPGSVPDRSLARYGLAGVSGTTAGTPSGLMLKARKVNGSLPGLPHWWTRPKGS
jgi:hypothetical protein